MLKVMKRFLKTVIRGLRRLAVRARYFFACERYEEDFSLADQILRKYHPAPESSSIVKNRILEAQYDLMIIVPVYNAEKWIAECLDSIISQKTNYSYYVKVINDGSTDHTGEVLKQYENSNRICIINQENRGYSGARNRGLETINSRYVMFVDADDYLLPDAIENLMKQAVGDDLDVVEGNGYRFDETGQLGNIKPLNSTEMRGVPWMKIYRADLFEHICFPEGYLYEDKIISALVLPLAKKKQIIPNEVYAYRIHSQSITRSHDANSRRLDSYWIMWLMQKEQTELGIQTDYEGYIQAMRQVVMTYRRTILLPDEIKRAVFVGTKTFLETYFGTYLDSKDQCRLLSRAIVRKQYGKYKVFCESIMI